MNVLTIAGMWEAQLWPTCSTRETVRHGLHAGVDLSYLDATLSVGATWDSMGCMKKLVGIFLGKDWVKTFGRRLTKTFGIITLPRSEI